MGFFSFVYGYLRILASRAGISETEDAQLLLIRES